MKAVLIGIPVVALLIVSALHLLPAKAQPSETLAAEALAMKTGCFDCHGARERVVGPSYRDIAARYESNAAARRFLIERLKTGGKGNWTEVSRGVPMPPYRGRLSDAEIERLVEWVLRQ